MDAISIEETNRIRTAIGLKPLPVPGKADGPSFKEPRSSAGKGNGDEEPGSTLESRQGAAYDNWKNLQDEAAAKAARDVKSEAVKKARDASRRFAKLEGKGLGEADEDGEDVDARTWLVKQKKRQKQIAKARRLEQELAEREGASAAATEYTAEDLAGVQVAHELDDFEAGDEQVLTLKDTTIDQNEDEGDELENADLRAKETVAQRLESKKRTLTYNPNEDLEDGDKSLLAKYDEEIDGKKRKAFTLGGQGLTSDAKAAMKQEARERLKTQSLNLSVGRTLVPYSPMIASTADWHSSEDQAPSDYQEPPEVKVRKMKKKKSKSTKRKALDDADDIFPVPEEETQANGDGSAMDVDSRAEAAPKAAPAKRSFAETSLVDDEDLQAALAVQRRNALKKRKKTGPAELARQIREEAEGGGAEMDVEEDGGLVIDETSEFVANIQKPEPPARRRNANPKAAYPPSREPKREPELDGDGDVDMSPKTDDVGDEAQQDSYPRAASPPAATSTGLDAETTLDKGIGSTLAMLTQRGLLKQSSSGDLTALHRERQRFLAEKQRREGDAERRARLQRERDRASGKLERMSAREKEAYAQAENKQRDQYESRQMAEVFNREYRPDIELSYVDEFGRHMSQKEAFKHLSHQFHGKGSGKHKTERRLKKIDEEKKREAQSALSGNLNDTTMGVVSKTAKTPGIRLQ